MRALPLLLAAFLFAFHAGASDFRELYREGKFSDALSALEQSPEAAAKGYPYYYNRGVIHHALNQDPQAVAYLEKARAIEPGSAEVGEPLHAATANLAKWLGATRLDATSFLFETIGEVLPLDEIFLVLGIFSVLSWIAFFLSTKFRTLAARTGFTSLIVALLFGLWGAWIERHPLLIMTESRLVKSGPGETFLDRGAVEPGMKLRVTGQMKDGRREASEVWWKVRFNERHDEGFVPQRSGLLLVDESNTPES